MLKQLTLHNFVLVESLDIDFAPGLTTITGESGAGKSILLNALGLLLGERASVEVIRPGAEKADVSAEFDVLALPAVQRKLAADELLGEDNDLCLVRRVVSNQGRSRAFINGIPVTTQYLRDLGHQLVDIHGQNEHQHLASHHVQLAMLDDFAGLAKQATAVTALYREWQQQLAAIDTLRKSLDSAMDRKDLLTYQLQELDEFSLQTGEFEQLETDHKRLSQAHETLAVLQSATERLDELDSLRNAARQLDDLDDEHADLESAQATLASALGLIDDATRDLRRYQDQVVVDPGALDIAEGRLNIAQDLARKHRIKPDQLPEHTEALRGELQAIDADSTQLDTLNAAAAGAQDGYLKNAKALSQKRRKAAPKFARIVTKCMQQLGIKDGKFSVEFEDVQGERGIDRASFYVTTNPNFPAGPLTQIASGGEQTRIALSIQIVAAEHSSLPCLILDEADVGVGGTTADTVGRILRELGQHTQVICVTHAPQVAALGNNHYRVVKQGDNTDIHTLDEKHRIDELARMLAGADITQKTRDYAQSLLQAAGD